MKNRKLLQQFITAGVALFLGLVFVSYLATTSGFLTTPPQVIIKSILKDKNSLMLIGGFLEKHTTPVYSDRWTVVYRLNPLLSGGSG